MSAKTEGDTLCVFINGKKVTENHADPETMLVSFLREKLRLTGTKSSCGGGGCGACTVMVSRYQPATKTIIHYSANSCLLPLCQLHGAAVTTVEGIGSSKTRIHPVQERIAKAHGSQCGFCTPGMVMSVYALLRNKPQLTIEDLTQALAGNLCRCTGYRPIVDGCRTFCQQEANCCRSNGGTNCCLNGETNPDQPEDEKPQLFDKEELLPLDPTQELIFPPELILMAQTSKPQTLRFYGERMTWVSPVSLEELVQIRTRYPGAPLVMGNTNIGPDIKFKGVLHPMIISPSRVQELFEVSQTPQGVWVGAGSSLSEVRSLLERLVLQFPEEKTELFRALIQQLGTLGSQQIRNVAGEFVHALRHAPRKEASFATVTTGMRVYFSEGSRVVQDVSLYFGGMGPTTVSADKTCKTIVGRPWDDQTLGRAYDVLLEELVLPPSAPGGKTDFRRSLTLSLFFKFNLGVLQKLREMNVIRDELPETFLPLPSDLQPSLQEFQHVSKDQSNQDAVGRPMMHRSAISHATGEAVYCDDIPKTDGELFLVLVTSSRAHAEITALDVSEALTLPGVVDVITAKDVPGKKARSMFGYEEELLAVKEVSCVGQMVCAVLADTKVHAKRGAAAVKITYKDLPDPVFTIEDAIEKSSYFEPQRRIEKGNVTEAFKSVDQVHEGAIRIGGQEHFYMETQSMLVVPVGEETEFNVYVSTQWPTLIQ
ncbi:transcript variant X3, partial [Nothobranchius furzeri]